MVKLKYSALYTDSLGCEQAEVYVSKKGFQLQVRNCIFENQDFDFDFYVKNSEEAKQYFYLKEDELIDYCIDIKMPMKLKSSDQKVVKEFLLRIEKNKNYYNNSLSLNLNDQNFRVEGYDLQELLCRMNEELSHEYIFENDFTSIFELYEARNDNKNNYEKLKFSLNRKSYSTSC
ncbi:DUF6304 family protein [Clostridium saccharoperbutylacetonicum]|uniref:DUF6304 family protein n=1 Tax=Clostridium saccharoperbutylacetonicum TaxID=36745 RepID=UPI0039E920BF